MRALSIAGLAALAVPSLVVLTLAAPARATPNGAPDAAPSADDVEEARRLFQSAVSDELAERYVLALEKFRRVQAVKDTPVVRLRIGACHERLHQLLEAEEAYASVLAHAGTERRVVAAAADGLRSVQARVPSLAVEPPAGTDLVELDGAVLPHAKSGTIVVARVNPGEHTVVARRGEVVLGQAHVRAPEGERVYVAIVAAAPEPDPRREAPRAVAPTKVGDAPGPEPSGGGGRARAGWLLVGAGAAAVGASALLFGWRESMASDINGVCPNGACPPDRYQEAVALKENADAFLAWGIVTAGLGILSAGAGAWLLAGAGEPSASRVMAFQGTAGARQIAFRTTVVFP